MNLEKEVAEILGYLEGKGLNKLAGCIRGGWQKTALAYSKELNTYQPAREMEPEMAEAFRRELARVGKKSPEKILDSIRRRRILQTAPHLVVTENPRMLCINWLGSLGVPDDEYYVVAMYSGIPFSNSFRPGRINKSEDSINLIPSNMQDDQVFRSQIPEKLVTTVRTLPEKLKLLCPEAQVGDSFTRFALATCGNIERQVLRKENLVYLDINEIADNYYKEKNEKYELGLFQTFRPFLTNHFKCFGSFRQVEYLPEFAERLGVSGVPTENLTTGEFREKPFPADVVLGEEFTPDPNMLFGELIVNMMDKEWLQKHIERI